MKILTAVVLGMFSGILTACAFASLFMGPAQPGDLASSLTNLFFLMLALVAGSCASTLWMLNQGATLSTVFRRGFLLGAAEWLAMIPVNLFSQARLATSHAGTLSSAGAVGLGVAAIVGVGFMVAMSVICLICFGVAYLIGRETGVDAANAHCPSCAEIIKAAAKRCRFCGADLAAGVQPPDLPAEGRRNSVPPPIPAGKILSESRRS
jgi:hypothetical protein